MKAMFAVVAMAAALAVSSLSAGEISRGSLAKMGLGGLQIMSDSQGAQVRGMGSSVTVAGVTFADANSHGSSAGGVTTYKATSSTKSNNGASFAVGSSFILGVANHSTAFAVGGSVAFAK